MKSGDGAKVACKTCGIEKGLDEYEYYNGYYRKKCRQCRIEYLSKRYYENEYVKESNRISNRRMANSNRDKYLEYINDKSCIDCGETDFRVLDFDHVNGDKKYNVSKMIGGSYLWTTILKEIAKCEVRCANCHRKRTYEEIQSKRCK